MIIEEGKARIIAPYVNQRGPGKVEGVFYNREMVFNRDTTIFLLHNLRVRSALDALAATGVRGIRMILENGVRTTINDASEDAYRIIKENVKLNRVDAEITNRDANSLLAERRFDYVDIDPFGSPVPFLDLAIRSARILGVSATDTATLSGKNRRIERRYLAHINPEFSNHEVGVRVLLGYIGRMAARFDLGIEPIFSLWRKHAYRVYVIIRRGSNHAKRTLRSIGNGRCGGPLWLGDIHDFEFLQNAKVPEVPSKSELEKYLNLWKNERHFMYYDIPQICSELHASQPSLSLIIDILNDMGYDAHRTHFSPQGIKTNADEDTVIEAIIKANTKRF